jgi:ribonuclease HII
VVAVSFFWHTNAGYATAAHREALQTLGPTRHHRAGFASVAQQLLIFD